MYNRNKHLCKILLALFAIRKWKFNKKREEKCLRESRYYD